MKLGLNKKLRLVGFGSDRRGTTAVEFAIVGPLIIALMFWFTDLAFSLYVQNSFTHAVNSAAREIYLDPDRTESEIRAQLEDELSRFGEVTMTLTSETTGSLDYHVINADMVYHFKSPPFNGASITLNAEGRAPVITYQTESDSEPSLVEN